MINLMQLFANILPYLYNITTFFSIINISLIFLIITDCVRIKNKKWKRNK